MLICAKINSGGMSGNSVQIVADAFVVFYRATLAQKLAQRKIEQVATT
jgi:hypothetical protein